MNGYQPVYGGSSTPITALGWWSLRVQFSSEPLSDLLGNATASALNVLNRSAREQAPMADYSHGGDLPIHEIRDVSVLASGLRNTATSHGATRNGTAEGSTTTGERTTDREGAEPTRFDIVKPGAHRPGQLTV